MNYRANIRNDYRFLAGRNRHAERAARQRVFAALVVLSAGLAVGAAAHIGRSTFETGSDIGSARSQGLAGLARTHQEAADAPQLVPELLEVTRPESNELPDPIRLPAPLAASVPEEEETSEALAEADPEPERLTVQSGDTLSGILMRVGVHADDRTAILADQAITEQFRLLRPGQELELKSDAEGYLEYLRLRLNPTELRTISRDGDGFRAQRSQEEYETRITSAHGVVESSLFLAAQSAGLSDGLIMRLVTILGWDIDFALDIREGDHFSVIYEAHVATDGTPLQEGPILAVEFVNRGRVVRALRYVDPEGNAEYYSPSGVVMRKAFLRTPVKFSRISSRFSAGRLHPVLNRIRAHKGVDYAAPTGTPVRAAGDGVVSFVGDRGGYGKTIVLQHGAKYSTLYGHLSRYAPALAQGKRIKQGDLIGYVGQTGLATGPHLHYEFRVDGVHKDPLTVTLPEALPIDKRYAKDFKAQTATLVGELDLLRATRLAQN